MQSSRSCSASASFRHKFLRHSTAAGIPGHRIIGALNAESKRNFTLCLAIRFSLFLLTRVHTKGENHKLHSPLKGVGQAARGRQGWAWIRLREQM